MQQNQTAALSRRENLGIVTIVGRPNVGKSTLFNRLTHSDQAIVDDQPGVTRDRLYGSVEIDEGLKEFTVIDTGGFEKGDLYYQPFSDNLVWKQTEVAIAEADIVLLMFDAKAGPHPHDEELVRYLKTTGKEVIYAVNKTDINHERALWDFYSLGVEPLVGLSAAHNRGVGELVELIEAKLRALPHKRRVGVPSNAVSIALIGKPNVGKSSILNRLIGEERSVVSDIAGTTRDTIDTLVTYDKQPYLLLDTAGIRRRAKVRSAFDKIETVSVMRSLRAVEGATVVLLVVDASEGFTDQDARLANLAASEFKPLLILVNKWDLIADKEANTPREWERAIRAKLRGMPYVEVMFISALTNQRVHKIMATVAGLAERYERRVDTSAVNEALEKMVREHTPALVKATAKRIKFYYATQVRAAPPTIVVFCNVAEEIQESYKRYMVNRFREQLGFESMPLKLIFRDKKAAAARRGRGAGAGHSDDDQELQDGDDESATISDLS